jgi:hypothetical protein
VKAFNAGLTFPWWHEKGPRNSEVDWQPLRHSTVLHNLATPALHLWPAPRAAAARRETGQHHRALRGGYVTAACGSRASGNLAHGLRSTNSRPAGQLPALRPGAQRVPEIH